MISGSRLLLVLACAFPLCAQSSVTTVRVEVHTKDKPVAAASVTLNEQTFETDATGTVTVSTFSTRLEISVSKEGFHAAVAELDVIDRSMSVRIELHEARDIEEEITVYATRSDVRLQDLPLRVEVLPRDEIEEKMLMSPDDIVMLLNETGGLRVQTTSPALGAASVRVRGMRGRYTRFLSDGLPLFGQQGAGLGLLQIPPMDLGQVEVIKGNTSALYGAGAMAGIIDLISRRPTDEIVREFLVNQTTMGGTDATGFVASRLASAWSMSGLVGGHWQARRDRDGDGWADLAGYARGVVRPRVYYSGDNGTTALFTVGITAENRSGGTVEDAVLPATGEMYPKALDTRRYDFGGNVQHILRGRYVVATRASASTSRHRHRFGEVRERDRHDLLFGEVSLRGTHGRHTWVVGTAAERDAYRPADVPRFRYTYVTAGAFVQDDVQVAPWLSVSASARLDAHNQFGAFFSPRVSALFRAGQGTSRISAGQGFFAPSPLTEETEAAGLRRLLMVSPLRAERARSGSLDVSRNLGPLSFTTTFFASRVHDPVHVDRGNAYQLINLSEATTTRGLELLGTWHKEPFAATASYTYVDSRELEFTGKRSDIALTPRHSLGLVGIWEQEGKSRVGVECYYTGPQRLEYDAYRGFPEPYVIFGIMGERRVHAHLKVFLNLENLSDVRQTRWDSLIHPSRNVDGRWTVDAWAPLDGRVVNGGIRFDF